MPNTALLVKNPLAATHEFKQACQLCYPKTGKGTPLCPGCRGRGPQAMEMGWTMSPSSSCPQGGLGGGSQACRVD